MAFPKNPEAPTSPSAAGRGVVTASTLTLYVDRAWVSPYVLSAFVALREKGLAFGVEEIALERQAQYEPQFSGISVTARVPTLVHGGFSLSESSAIVEYLDEAFPAPGYARLLPEGLEQRARARQLMAWVRSDLDALRAERPTTTLFHSVATTPLSNDGERAARKLLHVASEVIPQSNGPLFGTFSMADVDLAVMLRRLVANGYDVPAPVRAFVEAMWQRPSVRAFVEHPRAR